MTEGIGSHELHVVVGGTGAIGGAVVEELVRRGHAVRSIGRRESAMPAGVEQRIADVMDPQQAIDAIDGASVVYQCAAPEYTRWVQEFPALQANVADAAERAGARLVVIENLYMYGPSQGPMLETTPMAATGKKGSLRASLSRDLIERHAGRAPPRRHRPGVRLLRPGRGELGSGGAVLRRGRARQGPALDGAPGSAPCAVVPARHRGRARDPRRASGGRWRGLASPGQPGPDREASGRSGRPRSRVARSSHQR